MILSKFCKAYQVLGISEHLSGDSQHSAVDRSGRQQSYGCYKNSTVDLDIVLDDPILPNQASWPPPLHGNLYDGLCPVLMLNIMNEPLLQQPPTRLAAVGGCGKLLGSLLM